MPAFPGTVTPLAWFDGASGAMFADAAGTVPAAIGAAVRRVNEVSPLAHNWQTPAASLARRDVGGLNLEPGTAPPLSSASNAGSLVENDFTFIASWVPRDGDAQLFRVALPGTGAYPFAVVANSDGFYLLPGFASTIGARHTIGIQYTASFIRAVMWTNGVQTASTTLTMSVSGGSPSTNDYIVGQFQNYFYGILAQLGFVARAVTNAELGQLMAWADAQPAGAPWPLSKRMLVIDGDSIAVGSPGPSYYEAWRYTAVRSLRASYDADMLSVANGGTGVAGHFSAASPFLNALRPSQVVVFAAATNDMANGYTASVVLPIYLATLASYRAAGCKVVASTVLDRTGLFGTGITQGFFDTQRALFNAGVRASSSHYDALADTAAIASLGANGASSNLSLFVSDGVHPNGAGHALLAPVYTARIQQLFDGTTNSAVIRNASGKALRMGSGALLSPSGRGI